MPGGQARRPPATLVDPTTPGDDDEEMEFGVPGSPRDERAHTGSRGGRVAVGGAMMLAGAIIASFSFHALLFNDEAPTPLTERPGPGSTAATVAPTPSASASQGLMAR